ncbi:MAG TPA: hypothetical protein EYN38_01520 [Flavobacteriales bacterium]|nr:hypothetical protein [Flavobacteriales bacterium]
MFPVKSLNSSIFALGGRALSETTFAKYINSPEIDFDLTFDGKRNVLLRSKALSIDPHMGFELQYRDFIFLRGGIGYIQQITDFDGSKSYTVQPNLGLGVKIKGISIDYALTNIGQSVGLLSNVFSFKVDINKKAKST